MSSASVAEDDVAQPRRRLDQVERRETRQGEHPAEEQQQLTTTAAAAARPGQPHLVGLPRQLLAPVAPAAPAAAPAVAAAAAHDVTDELPPAPAAPPAAAPPPRQPLVGLARGLVTGQRVGHGVPEPHHHPRQRRDGDVPRQQRRQQLLDADQPRDGATSQSRKSVSVSAGVDAAKRFLSSSPTQRLTKPGNTS